MPILTDSLVERMLTIEADNLAARIGRYPGVHIARFAGATVFACDIPLRFFNSVLGTDEATLEHLDEIEAIYQRKGRFPTFEIVPTRLTERLGHTLHERGYAMVEFHAGLATELPSTTMPPADPAVRVEEVACDERFLDVYLSGWEAHDPEGAKANMRAWRDNPTWRFFIAWVDGSPAGAAILDCRPPTALLGSAGTVPAWRRRGVQHALIAQRAHAAAAAGCDLLIGGAYAGTGSLRNQQRAGLDVIFTRGIWVHERERAGAAP